ncbi:MAG: rhomboid family intramembrane serine protease [Planctomycetota bacterium]
MGIADRSYNREGQGGFGSGGFGGGGGFGQGGRGVRGLSITAWLVIVNSLIYLVQKLLAYPGGPRVSQTLQWPFEDPLTLFGHFSTATMIFRLEVWRLVSFQFLHANATHLIFNMIGLLVFGPMIEGYLGRKRYLAFYLLCGIAGGLLYLLLNLIGQSGLNVPGAVFTSPVTPLVGASAGVFGIIIGCARLEPNRTIMLIFPPIPLKLAWFAGGYVFIAVLTLVTRGNNAGGEAAHLGGAIAGFFFIRRAHLLADFFDVLEDSRKRVGEASDKRRRAKTAANEREIDRILAKVQDQGLHALSDTEKRLLNRASQNKRDVG